MHNTWSCSSCVIFLLFALLGREASASHVGRQWKDVHRIAKAQVTAHPLRRDEGSCPAQHTSCAASLSGGCCPSRYACATDSCYATTAGPTTACRKAGYFACAPVNGEMGCCPVGYVCGTGQQCIPPAGVTYSSIQCPNNYFQCPSSLNYGCCMSGMGCAASVCYSTAPVTTTILHTVTTTSGTETMTLIQTAVTVATPSPPSGLPTNNNNNNDIAAKFIPTSVPKVPESTPTAEPSGGLSGGAIGGIIAGVVILLIVVVIAAFLIIRRLKHVENIMESKQDSSSGDKKSRSQFQAQMEHYGRQLHSDHDDMSVDPLMVAPYSTGTATATGTPQPDHHYRTRADSTAYSPHGNPHDFNFTNARSRHASQDSYYDVPSRVQNLPGMQQAHFRGSTDSSSTYQNNNNNNNSNNHPAGSGYAYHHWRQQSNASELSADGSDAGGGASVLSPLVGGDASRAELDASGGYAELPAATEGYFPGGGGVRSRSSSMGSRFGHLRRRSDGAGHHRSGSGAGSGGYAAGGGGVNGQAGLEGQSSPTLGTAGLQGLSPLDEAADELTMGSTMQQQVREQIQQQQQQQHGFYGRRDQQAGQTTAGLDGREGHQDGGQTGGQAGWL
ncbi:hypothetical protein VTI74DRAFT_4612 [Chaetomium olivicolor]